MSYLRPIKETCLKQEREIAMKIQLLVNGGKILVQNLQLRKPGKRMKSTPSKSMHILNFHVNVKLVDLFHVDTVVTSSGLSTGNVEQVTYSSDTLMINFSEPNFEI